ncbi:MAG TPA: hypothetical protein DD733_07665, partial [Clostridiales bacterium]|nr:hypothetical protein [Clostridiales bacterium]
MSKIMNDKELHSHCQNAIKHLDDVIREFYESSNEKYRKRAMLISYWLLTYAKLIKSEDQFDSKSVYKLKRGTVIYADFGYRIGRELGGFHYAVVIDNSNSFNRDTVTVIPLSSKKEHSLINRYNIDLGNCIYSKLYFKIENLHDKLDKMINELNIEIKKLEEDFNDTSREKFLKRFEVAKKMHKTSEKWLENIAKFKLGSIALIDQITTISKMRICQPVTKDDPLYGI